MNAELPGSGCGSKEVRNVSTGTMGTHSAPWPSAVDLRSREDAARMGVIVSVSVSMFFSRNQELS